MAGGSGLRAFDPRNSSGWCLIRFRVSGFGFRVSGFGFRVSGFGIRASGFGFRDSGFGFQIPGFGCDPENRKEGEGRERQEMGHLSDGCLDAGCPHLLLGLGFRVFGGLEFRVEG